MDQNISSWKQPTRRDGIGGIETERLALNDVTVWSSEPLPNADRGGA
jgi:hypothetical protein